MFSTAASEALAAMASGALPPWAGQQQQRSQRQHSKAQLPTPAAQLRLYWGAAQAQGGYSSSVEMPSVGLLFAVTALPPPLTAKADD